MKKIIVSVIAILLILCMGYEVFATNITESELEKYLNELRQEGSIDIEEDEKLEQIPEGTIEKEDEKTDNVDNKTETLPTTTPHAGLGDYSGLIFVAIFAVLAVYAYKKVREYNA